MKRFPSFDPKAWEDYVEVQLYFFQILNDCLIICLDSSLMIAHSKAKNFSFTVCQYYYGTLNSIFLEDFQRKANKKKYYGID